MNKLSAKVSPCSTPPPGTLHTASTSEADVRSEECVSEQESAPSQCPCRCSVTAMLRLVAGVVLGVGIATAWVWAAHSAKQTLTQFNAPFFIFWFCSSWNLLMFPLYYAGHLLTEKPREKPRVQFRRCLRFLGDGEVTVRMLLRFSAPFSVFWSVSGFLYLRALSRTSVTDCSAVMCCNSAFTFLLTWICLKERFLGVRVVAVILSITGIVMLAYSDGFYSDSITGVALAVGSASCSALYNVLYRKRVGTLDPGPASILLCCVGLCVIVVHSWVCVLLYVTHMEFWDPSEPVPWNTLCTTASLLLVFNVLVNMGGVCTYPALISLGVLLTVPTSAAVDVWVLEAPPLSDMRSLALGLISAAFLLLLFPEDWDQKTLQWISSWRNPALEISVTLHPNRSVSVVTFLQGGSRAGAEPVPKNWLSAMKTGSSVAPTLCQSRTKSCLLQGLEAGLA
ncbi:solute carrier family 35 member F3 [Neoarius graeffei]|uniref:solute carrier family 35 member F3 n=1 Tax=Neoarius graeffei TaxID=443677 RepID=UPI00298D321F|nr:solute carrier family 35 member F3 [Neoarius graeffei]